MNKRGPVPIITFGIVAVLLVIGVGCLPKEGSREAGVPTEETREAKPTPKLTPEPTQALTINFSQAGNILNWDSQTETYADEWTLLHEKPGNPALSVNLIFNENSICDVGQGEKVCNKGELNNGDRVELEGNRVGDTVTVIRLKKLSAP